MTIKINDSICSTYSYKYRCEITMWHIGMNGKTQQWVWHLLSWKKNHQSLFAFKQSDSCKGGVKNVQPLTPCTVQHSCLSVKLISGLNLKQTAFSPVIITVSRLPTQSLRLFLLNSIQSIIPSFLIKTQWAKVIFFSAYNSFYTSFNQFEDAVCRKSIS